MKSDRFANILGEEYNLFNRSVPHHDEFQNKVGEIVRHYAVSLGGDTISVVEGGSGTGLTTVRILDADKRVKLMGIDNEEKTINQARVILEDYGKRVDLREQDLLEALKKMPNESADVFVSVWVIHNLTPEYRSQLFSEIRRVLKIGGLFVNGDKYARDKEIDHKKDLENQIKAFDVFDTLGRPDLKKEWTEHYREDEKIEITEGSQIKILKSLGFCNIEVSYRKGMEAIITAIR